MEGSRRTDQRDDRSPLVTIGIPTYNRAGLLQGAVASVLAQTHAAIELVIADNCSTDETEAVVAALVATNPSIRSIRHQVNLGPAANFEAVRHAATGRYFMWLADDDRIPPGYIEACVAVLESAPGVALAAGVPNYYEDDELRHEGVRVNAVGNDPVVRVLDYYRQVDDNGTFYGLIPTAILRSVPPIPRCMGGDWLFVAALAAKGDIRTVTDTEIRRAVEPTNTFRRVAEVGGHSGFEGRYPYIAIAAFVAREAAWRSPVYRDLGARRFLLALRSTMVIFRRFIITGLRPRSLKRRARNLSARVRRRTGQTRTPRPTV